MEAVAEKISVGEKIFHAAESDPVRSAEKAGLVYVTSDQPGYSRVRNGTGFYYMDGKKRLRDKNELDRKSVV